MTTPEDIDALWLHARTLTLVELAETSGLEQEVLRELVDFGALQPQDPEALVFSGECVGCVRAAARLGADLELDTPALALVLSFLDRIERLEAEVRHLSAQLATPRR